MHTLHLKKREDRRLRSGHLWIFSNEVDVQRSPLTEFIPGQCVNVQSAEGRMLGTAYVNPASLICGRIISHKPESFLDGNLLRERLRRAFSLREHVFSVPYYRLCHGEGDFLPGLVIDRYDSTLAVQISTAGMESVRDILLEVLEELFSPQCISLRNDIAARDLENIPRVQEDVLGVSAEYLYVPEQGARFRIPFAAGQKTGWFYDQRRNRAEAARYARGRSVLDAFCYAGGFGVACAMQGAESVSFLDSSQGALESARYNLESNAPQSAAHGESRCYHANAMHALEDLQCEGKRFGLVSIDPPAFMKRRKDAARGLAAYKKVNGLALDLLQDGGVLVTSSCSHHLSMEALYQCMQQAAAKRGLQGQVMWQGIQASDHPVHYAMPETAYLTCIIAKFWS